LFASEFFIDDPLECVKGLSSIQWTAVDEECRRARHAGGFALADVGVDAGLRAMAVETVREAPLVEAGACGVSLQVIVRQLARVREKHAVVFPEPPLLLRACRGFGSRPGVRVVWQRVM